MSALPATLLRIPRDRIPHLEIYGPKLVEGKTPQVRFVVYRDTPGVCCENALEASDVVCFIHYIQTCLHMTTDRKGVSEQSTKLDPTKLSSQPVVHLPPGDQLLPCYQRSQLTHLSGCPVKCDLKHKSYVFFQTAH